MFYGVGVHVTDAIEVFSREREQITDGAAYDLVYFLDEGLPHYLQFFPFFFVMGWFLIHDRRGRTGYSSLAVFFDVAHWVERAVGIIEGGTGSSGRPAWCGWWSRNGCADAAWVQR